MRAYRIVPTEPGRATPHMPAPSYTPGTRRRHERSRTEMTMPDLRDRHDLVLSTRSPSAVEQYVHAMDRQLSLNAGGVEGMTAALEADPAFALGQAGLAFAQWYRQDVPAAKVSVQKA